MLFGGACDRSSGIAPPFPFSLVRVIGGGGLVEAGSDSDVVGTGNGAEQLDLHSLARVLSTKMMAMPRDGNGSSTDVLQGCLEVLRDLMEIEGPDGTLLDGTELGQVRC